MLAIPFITAKYERVFSSLKHLVTNNRNRLKANIIKVNECLKSQYGRPKPKAIKRGVDPNVNNLYKEEIAAKAAAKAAAKKDSNIQGNVDQDAGKGGKQEGQGDKGNKGDKGNEGDKDDKDDKDNKSQEEDKGNKEDNIKYIVVNG